MVYTWLTPWWAAYIEQFSFEPIAKIVPTGLWIDMSLVKGWERYTTGLDMPSWFTPAMWAYFGICMAALLFSLFEKGKKINLFGKVNLSLQQLIIGLVGISYIGVAIIAVIVISIRAGQFLGGIPLVGEAMIDLGGVATGIVVTQLEYVYWLAIGTGLLLLVWAI